MPRSGLPSPDLQRVGQAPCPEHLLLVLILILDWEPADQDHTQDQDQEPYRLRCGRSPGRIQANQSSVTTEERVVRRDDPPGAVIPGAAKSPRERSADALIREFFTNFARPPLRTRLSALLLRPVPPCHRNR
jgi:hypothetical protein